MHELGRNFDHEAALRHAQALSNLQERLRSLFIYKRKHFEHEKEYRAIIRLDPQGGPTHDWSKEEFEEGKMILVDVDKLIEKVVVHPQAEEKFIEKLSSRTPIRDPSVLQVWEIPDRGPG